MSLPNADNIVFNYTFNNESDNVVSAEYYTSRSQVIVNHVEDYYVRLMSAVVPMSEIPLFNYKNNMIVGMYNATTNLYHEVVVQFQDLYNEMGINQSIVYEQQFYNGVNAAMRTCHIAVGNPGAPPVFIIRSKTSYLVFDAIYNKLAHTVFLNDNLTQRLLSYMISYDPSRRMSVLEYGDYVGNYYAGGFGGGITYDCYVMEPQGRASEALQEYLKIIVTCTSMKINKQYVNNSTGESLSFGVIDTIPIPFDNLLSAVSINYSQDFPSYNDLVANGPLSEIDFKLYLVGKDYRIYPLLLAPRESITMQFEFINKKLVKNYYPKV